MSKKSEVAYSIRDKIAMEEFVFVVESSTEIISDIVSMKYSLNQEEFLREKMTYKWWDYIANYYKKYKASLYLDCDAIINGEIIINDNMCTDLLLRNYRYIEEECDSEGLKISILYKGTLLARHFMDKNVIMKLQSQARDFVKKLTSVGAAEYLDRLENAFSQLNSLHDMIIKAKNEISPEIKFWRELIMEESSSLMKEIQEKRLKKHSQKVRVLILNSLIKVAGISPDKQEDKERFISEVLDLDTDATSTYLKELVEDRMGLSEVNYNKQLKSVQITCELLKGKGDDETDSDRVVKALVNHIELAGTSEYRK